MGLFDDLQEVGVDVEDALVRLMGDFAIYEKMIKRIPANIEMYEVEKYFENGDFETVLTNTHTLKGYMGNLSVTPLYKGYSKIVELLRAEKYDEARQVYFEIIPIQEKIVAVIKEYC